jgi:hypothetical protein
MTMMMPMEVSERTGQAFSCVAGFCAPDCTRLAYHKNSRRRYLSELFHAGCYLFFLLRYDRHRCGASPVKRAPSRLIPFPRLPRRLLIACLYYPVCRFPTLSTSLSRGSNEHAACLRFFCPVVRCHEIPFSFRVARSTGGFLYSIGVALVNIPVDLDSIT